MQLWKAKFVIAFNSLVMHMGGKEKENKPVFRPASRSNKKKWHIILKIIKNLIIYNKDNVAVLSELLCSF